jgi:hypothetical protein
MCFAADKPAEPGGKTTAKNANLLSSEAKLPPHLYFHIKKQKNIIVFQKSIENKDFVCYNKYA